MIGSDYPSNIPANITRADDYRSIISPTTCGIEFSGSYPNVNNVYYPPNDPNTPPPGAITEGFEVNFWTSNFNPPLVDHPNSLPNAKLATYTGVLLGFLVGWVRTAIGCTCGTPR